MKNQRGFTLVEIMMVVIIIGILAVLAIPRYEKYTIESKLSEVAVAVGEIKTGMEKYYNSHGQKYPAINSQPGNASLNQVLRIDLGQQDNFAFHITTHADNGYTGYKVVAYLTDTGQMNEYSSATVGDTVTFYFPKELFDDWKHEAWVKGWNDDDFFD
ncbi:MAG: prepilin-type N-terminal cleavage/methylation domain-containing protein [Deltaproteobacteria bacterium]|nr:prepilin-type N-terminal cleavage/methylation domain-containing protein [Deltaproteobacteria bacterium]